MDDWGASAAALMSCLSTPLGLFLLGLLFLIATPHGDGWCMGRRRVAMLLFTIVFALCCTPRVGKVFLSILENMAPLTDPNTLDANRERVIVILGGGAVAEGEVYRPSLSSERRLRSGLALVVPKLSRLMISGIESPLLATWLKERGCSLDIVTERRSNNTAENIRFCAEKLARLYPASAPRPFILLVTDRYHTLRVLMWAQTLLNGFDFYCLPSPALTSTAPKTGDWLPSIRGMERTAIAWREILALTKDWLIIHLHLEQN